ncbi:hypothetical protein [Chryseobacterium sp. T1]
MPRDFNIKEEIIDNVKKITISDEIFTASDNFNLIINNNNDKVDFELINVIFKDDFYLGINNARTIKFEKCSFAKNVYIKQDVDLLIFSQSCIFEFMQVSGKIGSFVFTYESYFKKLSFLSGEINDCRINIYTNPFENSISFEKCKFKNIRISPQNGLSPNVLNSHYIATDISEINPMTNGLSITLGDIYDFECENLWIDFMFSARAYPWQIQDEYKVNIKEILINRDISPDNNPNPRSHVKIRNFHIKDVNIEKLICKHNFEGNIIISNSKINSLELINFEVSEKFQIVNTKSFDEHSSILKIKNTNLNNIEFYNTNLNSFRKFEIERADLSEMKITESKPPAYDKIKTNKNSLSIIRQFKSSYKKQEDMSNYLNFLALENNELLKRNKVNNEEWLLLFLNKWSNNFGTSWIRGVIFTLGISITGFILTLFINSFINDKISYPYFIGCKYSTSSSIMNFNEILKEWLAFTFSIDYRKFDGFMLNGYVFLSFTFFKLLIGYGIYQTIAAFRKYGK